MKITIKTEANLFGGIFSSNPVSIDVYNKNFAGQTAPTEMRVVVVQNNGSVDVTKTYEIKQWQKLPVIDF
jgi:hypothetical protein